MATSKVFFFGGDISGNQVGISIPADGGVEISAHGLSVQRNGIGLEVRDPIIESMGLRPEAPREVVVAAVEAFQKASPVTDEAAAAAIEPTGIAAWLAAGRTLVSVASCLRAAAAAEDGLRKLLEFLANR